MGLKTDIETAFLKSMFPDKKIEDLSDKEKGNIPTLATDLTKAVEVFLLKQTWQITDMKAFVELDELEITQNQIGDVQPGVTTTVTGGSMTGGAVSGTGTVPPGGGKDGVLITKIEGSKGGIQSGGKMTATGHAFVGSSDNYPDLYDHYDTDGNPDGFNPFSKVKIESFEADD